MGVGEEAGARNRNLVFFPTSLCGVLVFDSVSVPSASAAASASATLSHTIFHTQLCHTPSFSHSFVTHSLSHNFVTHHLSHTTLSHTHTHHLSHIFHTQLCHIPSYTHNFVTHHLSHNFVTHTLFHAQLCHTPSFTHNFVTHHLSHTILATSTCTLPGRAWHLWHWAGSGGALGHLRFAWQAWHFTTSPSFRVAGVALGVWSTIVLCGMSGNVWWKLLAKHSGMFTETLGASHA